MEFSRQAGPMKRPKLLPCREKVTDEHFERAAQKAAQQATASPRTETQLGCERLRFAKTCGTMRDSAISAVAEAGIETSQDFAKNLALSGQGGAESGAVRVIAVPDDPRLLALIDAWPMLSEDSRDEIARLAGVGSDDADSLGCETATPHGEGVSR